MRKIYSIALIFLLVITLSAEAGKKKGGKKARDKISNQTTQPSVREKAKAEVAFSGFSFEEGELIEITADKMNLLLNERQATFLKKVLVKKGGSSIYCDKLEVRYLEEGEIDWLRATGAVKVIEGNSFASGEELEYFKDKNQFVLKGNPRLVKQGQIVLGTEMVFDLAKNRLWVTDPEIQFQREKQ